MTITHLLTDTLPVLVIKSAFSLLSPGSYLCQSPLRTDTNLQVVEEKSFTTTSRNVTIVDVLDFVVKNSNVSMCGDYNCPCYCLYQYLKQKKLQARLIPQFEHIIDEMTACVVS